ncbi:hypothetical protein D3C80_1122080 [compost metagenome]
MICSCTIQVCKIWKGNVGSQFSVQINDSRCRRIYAVTRISRKIFVIQISVIDVSQISGRLSPDVIVIRISQIEINQMTQMEFLQRNSSSVENSCLHKNSIGQ